MDGVPKLPKDWSVRKTDFYRKDDEVPGGGIATRDHHRASFPGVTIVILPGPMGVTLIELEISRMQYTTARNGAVTLFENFMIRAQGYGGIGEVANDAVEHAVSLGLLEVES